MISNISKAYDTGMLNYMVEVQVMAECPGPKTLR